MSTKNIVNMLVSNTVLPRNAIGSLLVYLWQENKTKPLIMKVIAKEIPV